MTVNNDRILDMNDKINSLEFCLSDHESFDYVRVDRLDILRCLDSISDKLVNKTSNFRRLLEISKKKKVQDKKDFESVVNNRITVCMSLALKIECIKMKMFENDKDIRLSQHVAEFIQNV
jgi:hypothetical protein